MLKYLLPCLTASVTWAVEPTEIAIIANKDMPESLAVAKHYCEKRKVPEENIFAFSLPKGEDITRADYDAKLVEPLRTALKDKKDKIKVLLTVYGVPLRVGTKILTADEKSKADEIKKQLDEARREQTTAENDKAEPAKIDAIKRKVGDLNLRHRAASGGESLAAVDSELICLWWEKYELVRWQLNPHYWQTSAAIRNRYPNTLMTCRLDGPTPEIARRLVDDAIAVEAVGLKGKSYFDARGIKFNPNDGRDAGTGYGGYDESFREAAALLKKAGLDVTLDDKNALFEPNSCKEVVLYAGWYSHANFIDCCEFRQGAVAWHLASSEATTLRNAKSKVWCPNLLQKGVAATMGPVSEPYTIGFPKPAEFFGFLATGQYTLVETYSKTIYFCSWMTVLVGDPLYNPFRKNPAVKEADIKLSPIQSGK